MLKRLVFLTVPAVVFLLSSCSSQPEKITLIIAGGASGQELELTVAATQRFMAQNPNIRVGVRPIPTNLDERLELYRQMLSRASDQIDVLQIDVVWVGMLANYGLDLNGLIPAEEIEKHFPSLIENNTVDGELVAMPLFADAPSLFYRKDLLEKYGFSAPPKTWNELVEMSETIALGERKEGNLGFWGYLWQGINDEALTCNALEWQQSSGGGNFLNDEGDPHLASAESIGAFKKAASWVGSISPEQVVEFDEEDSRLMWQRGDAAFLRNWSYVFALASQNRFLRERMGVAPLPAGPAGRSATLGGWELMVSKFSGYPREAAALVRFMTSESEQKTRAIEGSYNPTIRALYQDAGVLRSVPFFEGFEETYKSLVVRPSTQLGAQYAEVSSIYSGAVHDILEGADAETRLTQAEEEIAAVLHP
jgi:trehalose/maltose transport system substrate-binding protein